MRFVPVKTEEQTDVQCLHRIRDQMIMNRTRLINQMRAFCLEYRVAIRQGAGIFKVDLPRVTADSSNDLSPGIRRSLADLFRDLQQIEERISSITSETEALVARDDVCPPLNYDPRHRTARARALLGAVGDGKQFRRARDMTAWLGLTPREHSTRGKQRLLGISKGAMATSGDSHPRSSIMHDPPRAVSTRTESMGIPIATVM